MDEEEKIKITGEDSSIKIDDSRDIKVEGKDAVIKIEDKEREIEIKGEKTSVKIEKEGKEIEIKGKDAVIKIEDKKFDIKECLKKTVDFFKQKKVINVVIIVLLLLILIGGTWIRLQNLPNLIDSTTGEYIPLALDPFYFLRVAETIVETGGDLPAFDSMRQPFDVAWHPEILPKVLVGMYKATNIFGDYSLQYIDVIYPVIFFILGLIVFFFLVYLLTKSKITALLSSVFLAFIPSYLYRTMAGFADHEAIGMFSFFLALLIFGISLKYLEKESENKKELGKVIGFSLLVGFTTALTIASWGGIAKFLFMIIPLAFFIFWLTKCKEYENKQLLNLIFFYVIWIIATILFGMLFGFDMPSLIGMFLSTTGLLSLFVPVFMIVDYLLIKNKNKIKNIKQKYRQVYSIIITGILGIISLWFIGKNPFNLIGEIWNYLLHPFGLGRVGLTVAENAQPYLLDWMNQTGKIFFWMFIAGLVFIGIEIGKKIQSKKERNLFVLFWIIMFSGILFSRISETHLLNGANFISQAFYIIGLLIFIYYTAKLYFNNKIKISPELIIVATWMFFMIISAKSAIRFFFVITPFVCFSASFFVVKTFDYIKRNKDELIRILLIIILILGIIGAAYSLIGFYKTTKMQAKYTGPSANVQWQGAMSWTRENTQENSIFAHWWDYGYWVQYLGERPTIADGGYHPNFLVHNIGRYVLTTPYPETALSFMKTYNVSYLLIDPTDLGKYSAYSKIGSDDEWDRFAYISPFISEESQIQETSTGTIRIFQGGIGVDEDIVYEPENDSKIFIPGPTYNEIGSPSYKAFVGGIIFETMESDNGMGLKQPEAVFMYNNQQIKIPLRYVYYNGEIKDFEKGLDAVFFVLPRIQNTGQIDNLGAGLYLSPKVSKSLFAQLYLMNDVFDNYETVKLAHSEQDQVVNSLKMQGLDIGEFVYYQGFRGPIKIWEVQENENILVRDEFLRRSGDWAEFDDLELVK